MQNQSCKTLTLKLQFLKQKNGREWMYYNAVNRGLKPASPFTDTGHKPSIIPWILVV